MAEIVTAVPTSTLFERIWQQPSGHLFKSQRHEVMAIADAFPKMPLQVVVAPAYGNPGEEESFYDAPLAMQRKLLEVGLAVGAKILRNCRPGQRSMFTLEGFAVKDHAHIVYYAGARGEGANRYTGSCLGDMAVQQTLELVAFTTLENELLEARLDQIEELAEYP